VVAIVEQLVNLPGPRPPGSNAHAEKRQFHCFGRLFGFGEEVMVYIADAQTGNEKIIKPVGVARIVSVTDASGRMRSPHVIQGWSTGEERERYLAARRLAGMRWPNQNLRAEARRIAASACRWYLTTRRWCRENYDRLYAQPTMDHSLPKPRRTIRARVA
jgi:hypothetical protein